MTGLVRPFIKLLFKRQPAIPRRAILLTLFTLAFLKRRFPNKSPVKINLGKYTVTGPDYSLLSLLIKEKFVEDEYHFETGNQNPVIFDCGASIGISMIYFKAVYPEATIHCFEPNPGAFSLLQENAITNKFSNTYLYETALTASGASVILQIPDQRGMINAGLHLRSENSSSVSVRTTRLSEYIVKEGGADLVKIDVEGSEYEIINELQSSGVLQTRIVKQFIIEYHTSALKEIISMEQFCSIFEQQGYGVSRHELFAGIADSDWMIRAVAMGRKR